MRCFEQGINKALQQGSFFLQNEEDIMIKNVLVLGTFCN